MKHPTQSFLRHLPTVGYRCCGLRGDRIASRTRRSAKGTILIKAGMPFTHALFFNRGTGEIVVSTAKPCELVIEVEAGAWIAIGQIKLAVDDAVDRSLYVAALRWAGIIRQLVPRLVDLADPAEDGNAVPALLAVPDRVVAETTDRGGLKLLLRCFQLLQTDDVRPLLLQSAAQHREAAVTPFTL